MSRILLRHLKTLRHHPVPTETISAGRLRLVAAIASSPRITRPSTSWFAAPMWKSAMAVVIAATTITSGGAVFAAQGAQPGERLYAVKLASETLSERLSISPQRRFTVQAKHAERRLEETKVLLEDRTPTQPVRTELVRATMHRYEDRLFAMNEIAEKMAVHPPKPSKGRKTILAAGAVLDRHVDLMASATVSELVVAEAVLDSIEISFNLEADVFEAMPPRAERGAEDDDFDRRRQERTEKIESHLDDLRRAFQVQRALEIKAGL